MAVPQVFIRKRGSFLQITPPLDGLLQQTLTLWRRDRVSSNRESLYVIAGQYLVCPSGMYRAVVQTLEQAGWQVLFKNDDPKVHHCICCGKRVRLEVSLSGGTCPLCSALKSLHPVLLPNYLPTGLRSKQDDLFAAFLADLGSSCVPGGLLEGPTGLGKTHLIKQICACWVYARILLVIPYSRILQQTKQALQKSEVGFDVGVVDKDHCEPDKRIVLTTDKSLVNCRLDDTDLMLFDEVHRAGSPSTNETLAICPAIKYGLSATTGGRSDKADKQIVAWFGPVLERKEYHEVMQTGAIVPLHIHVVSCKDLPKLTDDQKADLPRFGLWRNLSRHMRVAEAVRWAFRRWGEDIQILVMCEKTEHVVRLSRLLPPGFQLMYGDGSGDTVRDLQAEGLLPEDYKPLSDADRIRMTNDFHEGKIRRVVTTPTWSVGVDFPGLDVLVRADGSASYIANVQMNGRNSRSLGDKLVGNVIDLDDAFDDELGGRWARREAIYRSKQWAITFMDSLT